MWSGRVNAPAPASTATASASSAIGAPPATIATIAMTASVRIALVQRRTASVGQRAAGRPTNGARTVGVR